MAAFWKVAGLPLLIVSLLFAALAYRSLHVKSQVPPNIVISTVGLDDLGIHLQAPYGTNSIHHALIVNESSHHILACEVVFEFVTRKGDVQTSRRVVSYSKLLLAQPKEREALFKSGLGLAPHSKLLVSVGMDGPDLVLITDKLPPLNSDAGANNQEVLQNYGKVIIRLNAVVLENGESLGPGAKEFTGYLQSVLKEGKP